MKYKPVIGLEIHAELNTKTKMFCGSLNDPNETKPNTNVCPVCLAHPGTLPVINIEAVHKVVKTGLALGARINELSWFERKNYFYPDLPKGYQISQYEKPFCDGGIMKLTGDREIKIKRVHLEEDTGRLVHEAHNMKHETYVSGSMLRVSSFVDFNRAGVPLMELVTEPDIKSGAEAKEFGEELQLLFRYLNVSGADMEKGQLRIEANISLMPEGSEKLGTKVEIKNLNSFRACERAIDYEIKRQTEVLDRGDKIVQETRGWNETEGHSFSQREKEESHDYRYFPEPDLPPVRLEKSQIDYIKSELPELPALRRERFIREYGITAKDSEVFIVQKELGDYFEEVASELKEWLESQGPADETVYSRLVKLSANYLITELQKLLSESKSGMSDLKISAEDFAELIVLIHQGKISSSAAQTILAEMFATGEDPSQILEDKNLVQVSDRDELVKTAQEIIAQNPKPVEDYKKGKLESLKFLVGQLMRATKGQANPQVGEKIIKELLG
ncbi:MAG: Asp-tRNA(Asn)/Glu-tRNA(Gln) amidotransferase subunit GatB [Candidatus Sungbacteria bacterium]|uniref:Aspartyl/glutamyl-tRNA(Asn/Gln) amidotransferase subunit B n=1 Tax=Candidatus Sungiibacteriota bacterium TaxID=2750080 RepID=A0A9D6DNL2_9BACT|nr:Asp-tRNA(Asn)/Glu-tRNA(Gln) amidotransferase subunit GatB [Candidatus Sungbacteria bacterium]